ncbi:MAG TPA: DUF4190 domain-containing protein [Chitinophagales bacterium]|nr:DUF4190 domain-containing protein [Chitinophagales bacterium]
MRYSLILILSILLGGCGLNKPLSVVQPLSVEQPTSLETTNEISDTLIIINRAPSGMQAMDEVTVLPSDRTTNIIQQQNFRKKSITTLQQEQPNQLKKKKLNADDEPTPTKPKMNIWAIMGFVFVLTGVIPIIGNLVGYIMCIVALNQINKNPGMYTGKGLALAGFVIFTIFLVAAITIALFYFGLLSFNGS